MLGRHSRALPTAVVGLFSALWLGCAPSGEGPAVLTPDERAFVDTYVRILVLDARRGDLPDSVGPALDRLAASHDSLAIRAAFERLDREPERWEVVYAEIAKRLHALEREPTPSDAWRRLESAADSLNRP